MKNACRIRKSVLYYNKSDIMRKITLIFNSIFDFILDHTLNYYEENNRYDFQQKLCSNG